MEAAMGWLYCQSRGFYILGIANILKRCVNYVNVWEPHVEK